MHARETDTVGREGCADWEGSGLQGTWQNDAYMESGGMEFVLHVAITWTRNLPQRDGVRRARVRTPGWIISHLIMNRRRQRTAPRHPCICEPICKSTWRRA